MNVSWTAYKNFLEIKGVSCQYIEDGDAYYLSAYDGNFRVDTILLKSNSNEDLIDFETNYKPSANSALWQMDTDGAQITRAKAAKKGWSFAAVPIEFATSRLQSDTTNFYAKKYDGTDRDGITLKIYNNADEEITTAGLLDANLATAVKTVIDFEPPYDFEVIGGSLRTLNDITSAIRLWIIAVPDIPYNLGGTRVMAGGLNLNYLVTSNIFAVDGRVSKFLKYDAVYHTNKLRLIFKYPAGTFENIQVVFELYRQ